MNQLFHFIMNGEKIISGSRYFASSTLTREKVRKVSVLAVDLGGSHVGLAVVADGRVLAEATIATDARSISDLLPEIEAGMLDCCEQAGINPRNCRGIGFGIPSLVDGRTSEVLSAFNKFADLDVEALRKWSGATFGLPLRMENDAALALLGEHRAGAARGFGDVVLVTLGTGIGVSAMLGHRLLRSRLGHAGSLGGHFIVKMDGRQCACGAIGCAEAEASTSALPAIAVGWPGFSESQLAASARLNYAEVFRAKNTGDRVAREIVEHSIAVWSALAVTLVHAYGPQLILFGGGVMARGEEILGPVRECVQRHTWRSSRGFTRIESAALGTHAAFVGGEALFEEGYV
jgi:glucokinase